MFVDEKAQGEALTAEQANRTLKLSEAIRIGAKLRGQATFGGWFDKLKNTSCAIGAAFEANGGQFGDANGCQEFACKVAHLPLSEIFSRNDNGQTREQIADWLESQGY